MFLRVCSWLAGKARRILLFAHGKYPLCDIRKTEGELDRKRVSSLARSVF